MEALKGYERSFKTALESGYARHFGSNQYNALNAIYERITGKKYSVNYGCSYCALQFIKALGKMYFDELKRQEEAFNDAVYGDDDHAIDRITENGEVLIELPDGNVANGDDLKSLRALAQPEPEPKPATPSKSASKSTAKKSSATNKKQNKK